jgi:hypothetical protein
MSRGPGRLERAIRAAFKAEPDNAFTIEDLCDRVFPGVNRVEKKHRVSVIRAAKRLAKHTANIDMFRGDMLGRALILYDPYNVMSNAMARLKADAHRRYRSHDERWYTPHGPKWFDEAMGYEKGYRYRRPKWSEDELRASFADEDGKDHKHVAPGGAWWRETEIRIAERDSDAERLAHLKAESQAASQAALAALAHCLNKKSSDV